MRCDDEVFSYAKEGLGQADAVRQHKRPQWRGCAGLQGQDGEALFKIEIGQIIVGGGHNLSYGDAGHGVNANPIVAVLQNDKDMAEAAL